MSFNTPKTTYCVICLSSFVPQKANYYGSFLQASTVCLGSGLEGDVNVPFRDLLPMVHPNDIVFDGMHRYGRPAG